MKVSYEWLKEYIDLDRSASEIEEALTLIGFEVEEVVETGLPDLPHVVVGEVLSRDPHPNADRLSVCRVAVDTAGTEATIVCGAQNYKVGDRIPVALPGAVLPGNFKIKTSKLRGERSEGMLCSGKELGMSEDGAGLLILEQRPEVGMSINEAFPDNDLVFDVEVTPNRPDCLSHVGIARELAAYFGLTLRYPEVKGNFESFEGNGTAIFSGVEVNTDECPHYTAHVISGVRIAPSPKWLQRRLETVGLRPINNVVDITNFVLMELGQPLHAFDAAKIEGRRLIVRQAGNGEKVRTLDDKERTLSERMMVIADAAKPLVIAGVMGTVDAEVDDSTTDIVLESAYFRPGSVRFASRRLGLTTDSSYRFERGVDPSNLVFAAQRAADLILEIAGGRLAGPRIEVGKKPEIRNEIQITRKFIDQRCGFTIEDARVEEIFSALELEASAREDENGVFWTVEIPSFRADLNQPIDLIEELIRIHGTDKIPAGDVWAHGIIAQDHPAYTFNTKASDYLVGQHFTECVNYSLRSGSELKTWYSQAAVENLALANPLSSDQTHLRWSLVPGLLGNLKLNQDRKTGVSRLFETGRVFRELEDGVCEVTSVSFVILNDPRQSTWLARENADFYHARKYVEVLARLAGIDLAAEEVHPIALGSSAWQEGQSAAVGELAGGFEGRMGLISPFLLRSYDIEGSVIAGVLEILPSRLEAPRPVPVYRPFSAFPAAERDLGLVVADDLPAETVRRTLWATGREIAGSKFAVEAVECFDVYRGKGLPEGKKSLAFSLVFRATDRTLTDDEVNGVFSGIQEKITAETEFTIRH